MKAKKEFFITAPCQIMHSEFRPKNYDQMIRDAARNLHLHKQSTALLLCYAGHADGFRPALKQIEKETKIAGNKISEIRKCLAKCGVIVYDRKNDMLLVNWKRIRIFAALEKPLTFPRSKKYSFDPDSKKDENRVTLKQLGKRYRIVNPRKLTASEERYYGMLEQMTEAEFQQVMAL